MKRAWFSLTRRRKMLLMPFLAISLVACGSPLHAQSQSTPKSPAADSSTSLETVMQYTTGIPRLVMVHHTPSVLAINTSRNQLMFYHWVGKNQWNGHALLTAPLSRLLKTDALACLATGCVAAAAEMNGTGSAARIVVMRQVPGSSKWESTWTTNVPGVAAGQTLQLSANGSYLWLLSTGSPGAGMMPKLLWVSPNDGRTWDLVAAGDLPSVRAPLTMPSGYPTGLVATTGGHLWLSMSPRGNSNVLVVVYAARPVSQQSVTFSVPSAFRPVTEALPAIIDHGTSHVALIESSAHANGYLALATPPTRGTTWSIRQLEPMEDNTPAAQAGSDAVMIINAHSIQVLSPGHQLLTLPVQENFGHAPVGTVINAKTVLVIDQHGQLWINRGRRWHHFSR